MAITNPVGFLFNGSSDQDFRIDSAGNTASFEVDAVMSETHNMSRDVTDNEVENGAPISDNIIKRPITLEISAIVTDQPIRGTIAGISAAIDNVFRGSKYTEDCFGALLALYESAEVVTIYTEYRTYTNMAIEDITITRSPEDGESLLFSIRAKQIRKVQTATAKLPPGVGLKSDGKTNAKGAAAKMATPGKDLGQNTAKNVSDGASMLEQAKQGAVKTVGDLMKSTKAVVSSVTGGASF